MCAWKMKTEKEKKKQNKNKSSRNVDPNNASAVWMDARACKFKTMRQNKICSIKHREFQDYFLIKTTQHQNIQSLSCVGLGVCVCAARSARSVCTVERSRRIFDWYVDSTVSRQPLPNNSMGKYLRFDCVSVGRSVARTSHWKSNRTIWKRLCKYLWIFGVRILLFSGPWCFVWLFKLCDDFYRFQVCSIQLAVGILAESFFSSSVELQWKFSRNRKMQRHSLIYVQ